MEHVQKQTFILLLFPLFPTSGHQEAFDNLLRTARLVVNREFRRALSPAARMRPLNLIHAWVKNAAGEDADASVAVFLWIETGPLIHAAASLGTLDDRVVESRSARKVVVVPDELWVEVAVPHGAGPADAVFVTRYPGMALDKTPVSRPLLLLRQRLDYGFEEVAVLGAYLGTRQRRRAPSSAYLPQTGRDRASDSQDTTGPPEETFRIGVPSKPSREDETTREVATDSHPISIVRARRPSNGALEVRSLGSGRPDPRCEDEDLRDTIEPPPPEPKVKP
jgi:hypothetical protein